MRLKIKLWNTNTRIFWCFSEEGNKTETWFGYENLCDCKSPQQAEKWLGMTRNEGKHDQGWEMIEKCTLLRQWLIMKGYQYIYWRRNRYLSYWHREFRSIYACVYPKCRSKKRQRPSIVYHSQSIVEGMRNIPWRKWWRNNSKNMEARVRYKQFLRAHMNYDYKFGLIRKKWL